MSDERFGWAFELIDRVSLPARAMSKSFDLLEKAKKRLDAGVSSRASQAFGMLSDTNRVKVVGWLPKHGELKPRAGAGFQKLGGGAKWFGATTWEAAGGMAMFAAPATAGLGVVGAKFAYDAISFKEDTLTAF